MIKKPLKTEVIRENTLRHTLIVESDNLDTPIKSLIQLFRDIVDQPYILKCGTRFPDKITISKSDTAWTLIGTLEEQISHSMDYIEVKEEEDKSNGNNWVHAQRQIWQNNH